jgi:hypothetical protein
MHMHAKQATTGRSAEREGRLLHQFLADADRPCPSCGYNLRNLTADRCPECGQELRLQIGLMEPRTGGYIASLMACSAGMGASCIMMPFFMRSFDAPYPGLAESTLLVEFALALLFLGLILIYRRWFRRQAVEWQRTVAVCLWLLMLTLSIVLFRIV